MKKYGLAALIAISFITSTVYAHSQSDEGITRSSESETSATESKTSTEETTTSSSEEGESNPDGVDAPKQTSTSVTTVQTTESAREKYDGIGDNINYSEPSNNNYVAPPIFPFPDSYTLRLPQKITVDDVQVHPPILPFPHRMQYEVKNNLSGNSNTN